MSNITDTRAVADKLREAKALIERGWVQGICACDADHRRCPETDPGAAFFDVQGAASRVAKGDLADFALMISAFQRANDIGSIAHWNDSFERTQAEVLAAFDKAITRADSSQ